METLFLNTASARPSLMPIMSNYLKLWFHSSVYENEEGEVGGDGEMLFFSEVIFSISKLILLVYLFSLIPEISSSEFLFYKNMSYLYLHLNTCIKIKQCVYQLYYTCTFNIISGTITSLLLYKRGSNYGRVQA